MEKPRCEPIQRIVGAKILSPRWDPDCRYDILIKDHLIHDIVPNDPAIPSNINAPGCVDARDCLIAPSLCHAHIHLDKCFLLNAPKYADLEIIHGDFAEALELTSRAKARFTEYDLLHRGRWLIEESIAAGVTHIRAFVEIDTIVQTKCLLAAIKLKAHFESACHIQICAFAQDPLFSQSKGPENRALLLSALTEHSSSIEALGTTPYVESSPDLISRNITFATETALAHNLHLDLHLDYNTSPTTPCYTPEAIACFVAHSWPRVPLKASTSPSSGPIVKTLTLSHCTRLTLLPPAALHALSAYLRSSPSLSSLSSPSPKTPVPPQQPLPSILPLTILPLPPSDLYIHHTTLNPLLLTTKYGIPTALGVNNIGNAFTPQGSADPLAVASMGVGWYQAGRRGDVERLFGCVSWSAKRAVGFCGWGVGGGGGDNDDDDDANNTNTTTDPFHPSHPADFVIFNRPPTSPAPSELQNPNRRRTKTTLQHIVYDPPSLGPSPGSGSGERRTVYHGCLVSSSSCC